MKLKKLFKDIAVSFPKGIKNIEISGLSADSRTVAPGYLFIAKRGNKFDGNQFIPQAIENGAVAVLSDIYNPLLDTLQIIYPDIQDIEPLLANRFYSFPSHSLFTVGITGTNGKTTTAYLIKYLLEKEAPCGLISTVETLIGELAFPSLLTTPDILTTHKFHHDMVLAGCKSVAMEVSSHALDQGRVKDIDFDVAIFTNISHDHLDYHKSMENYLAAKGRLFQKLEANALAIINRDDPHFDQIISFCKSRVLTYGLSQEADVRANEISFSPAKTSFVLSYRDQKEKFQIPLVGEYNVHNVLAAISTGLEHGLSLFEMSKRLEGFTSVPGRLEKINNQLGLHLFVDYAHTPHALEVVLKMLSLLKEKRLITLFGCGGDRDREKRPIMAKVAEKFSDYVIVTSDNPRTEDPKAIVDAIVPGFSNKENFTVILDRKEAIEKAISGASKGDMLLIAGKGHEAYQILSSVKTTFDDRKVAQEICEKCGLTGVSQ